MKNESIIQRANPISPLPKIRHSVLRRIFYTNIDMDAAIQDALNARAVLNLKIYRSGSATISITWTALSIEECLITDISLTANISTTGKNGLDTGSVSTNPYFVFAIYDTLTAETAALFSLSETNPVLPAGFDKKRRIGYIYYSSGIKYFQQIDRRILIEPASIGSYSNTTWTAVDLANFLPPLVQTALIQFRTYSTHEARGGLVKVRRDNTWSGFSVHYVWEEAFINTERRITMVNVPLANRQFQIKLDSSYLITTIARLGWADIF